MNFPVICAATLPHHGHGVNGLTMERSDPEAYAGP